MKKGTESPVPVNNWNGGKGQTRDKVAKVHSFYAVPLVPFPTCFPRVYQVKGEDRVKTRSQRGYFWPTPIPGGEQREVRAHVSCHMEVVP